MKYKLRVEFYLKAYKWRWDEPAGDAGGRWRWTTGSRSYKALTHKQVSNHFTFRLHVQLLIYWKVEFFKQWNCRRPFKVSAVQLSTDAVLWALAVNIYLSISYLTTLTEVSIVRHLKYVVSSCVLSDDACVSYWRKRYFPTNIRPMTLSSVDKYVFSCRGEKKLFLQLFSLFSFFLSYQTMYCLICHTIWKSNFARHFYDLVDSKTILT